MSRDDPIFRLRLPDPLKERLKVLAEERRRSLTQEIVDRLQRSIESDEAPIAPEPEADNRLAQVEAELETLRAEVRLLGFKLKQIEDKL